MNHVACLAPLLPTFTALIQQSVFTPLKISVFYTRAPTGKQPAFFASADASPFIAAPTPPTVDATLAKRPSSVFQAPRPAPQPPVPQPAPVSHLPPGLTLAPGRPRLAKFLEGALQRAVTLSHDSRRNVKEEYLTNPKDDGRLSGMVVGVCGPLALADDLVSAVNGLDPVRRDQVGGVEICEEVFGW